MSRLNRRQFLDTTKNTLPAAAAGLTILANAKSARAYAANEKIMLAAVGCGGRSGGLTQGFIERGDCQFAYASDPDSARAEGRAKTIAEAQGSAPRVVKDFREALDDKSVDAIVSATPDHWHALSSVWACQAGKDVYVEKPATHSCWEGQKMIEAARKYDRVVQVGTQNRSAPYNMAARKYIEDGKLGEIYMCRIYNQKSWPNRDAVPDSDPPAGFNWDMWNGPAPEHAYNAGWHRYWNHVWRYSGGDIANDASHQIDLARWLCGVTYPQSAYSTGGRYASQGVAETPDTQVAVWQFDKMVMTFELTLYTAYMLKTDPVVRDTDMFPLWPQNATRIELYGTEGLMLVGRHGGGWQVFDRPKDRQPVVKDQMYGRFPDPEHKENFVQCIRDRKRPTADVEEGHRSALLIHYANISYRLGAQKVEIDPATEEIKGNPAAMEMFKRTYRAPYVIPETV
ncbi:MAG: Gfo/Idh/MocA family oxidoreductase [Planctomycetaceae bacterium]|nr:Gfo/Idh/MocA family oxidoreductase [Planctomycetaceae bacterium]